MLTKEFQSPVFRKETIRGWGVHGLPLHSHRGAAQAAAAAGPRTQDYE